MSISSRPPSHSPARSTGSSASTGEVHGKKIIQLIEQKKAEGKPFFSFEYFPPKTDAGVVNLYNRIENMSLTEPLFLDITWGAGGTTSDLTLELASTMQKSFGPEVMMHLTCTNMSIDSIRNALITAKENGVRNILALRGDPPHGSEEWSKKDDGFSYATDLVKFIRSEFGDWFGIGVAGYPEGHPDSPNKEDDLSFLKQKIDAGADFIVTQLFYDVPLFLDWVNRCRDFGIHCPILPGIMPIQNYAGFIRMTSFCKTKIPVEITAALEPIQQDDAAIRRYGVQLGAQMCRQLLDAGIEGVHLYTLNLQQSCTEILEELNLIASSKQPRRMLPWKQSSSARRNRNEDVRPIFWSNRSSAYTARTFSWDSFPNGRFGSHESPAYGELSQYHMCPARIGSVAERRTIWGETLNDLEDVKATFEGFIKGDIKRLPWCEEPLALESDELKENLIKLNKKGFLTINSQPAVNAASSDDKTFGWGPAGGYVFQKSYIEFFVSKNGLEKLIKAIEKFPQLSYCAYNHKGDKYSNWSSDHQTTAVTWGVFANSEIIQPTVVDAASFLVWKEEAFALWKSQWGVIYEIGTTADDVINGIYNDFFLVNVVDNDFVKGNLWDVFEQIE
jgi:methylenetetrahydrofolate reductase (NADPH)